MQNLLLRGLLAGALLIASVAQAAVVEGVRLWRAPDHTRLVFDMSGEAEHTLMRLDNPARLVIDLTDTVLKTSLQTLELSNTPVAGLRSGIRHGDDLRIVLDLAGPVRPRSFVLPANRQYGERLVLDLYENKSKPADRTVAPAREREASPPPEDRRDVVIAIDAGHGGEDPGAIGPGRIAEKTVVLAIARELKKQIDNQRGFRAVLIRDGDYYVGLGQRRGLTRKAQADLFLSIHADAFKSPKAYGSSVYALSQRGATSASAAFLAERENGADLIGGVSLDDKEELLAEVLTDLSMTATLDASIQAGSKVLSAMDGVTRLHKRQVEQAGFAVLKSPDIPSLLIETGFISNPDEARRLNTRAYRSKLARSINRGIRDYFYSNPPSGSLIAALKRETPVEHVIASGDTLSGIAQRYRVSVAAIRQTNGLSGSTIRTGQKLLIPNS